MMPLFFLLLSVTVDNNYQLIGDIVREEIDALSGFSTVENGGTDLGTYFLYSARAK